MVARSPPLLHILHLELLAKKEPPSHKVLSLAAGGAPPLCTCSRVHAMQQPMSEAINYYAYGKRGVADVDCTAAKRQRQAAPLTQMQQQPGSFFGAPTMMMMDAPQAQPMVQAPPQTDPTAQPMPIAMLAATASPYAPQIAGAHRVGCPPCFAHRFCRGNACSVQTPVKIGEQTQFCPQSGDAMQY